MNIEFSVVLGSLSVIVCFHDFHLSYNQFRVGEQEQQPAKVIHLKFNIDKLKTAVIDQKSTFRKRSSQNNAFGTRKPFQ